MAINDDEMPPALKQIRNSLLTQLKDDQGLDAYEISLFEWYARENAEIIERMLTTERAYIQEQINTGAKDLNDSGMIIVEYYIKRARYADLIYMTSLLEKYLERACHKLLLTVGDKNILFRPEELTGDKWTKRKKFIERYGNFDFPEKVWAVLKGLITIRNNLVHDNGDTTTLNENDKNMILKFNGVRVEQCDIVIDHEYVSLCLSEFRSLVHFINNKLDQIINVAIETKGLNI